jgi:adenosylmethionine-8-amino-7-oxononanoate aminotransferase
VGATSLGGVELFRRPFAELLFRVVHVANAAELRRVIDQHGDRLAAIVAEPLLQGAAGMRVYARELLQVARGACDATGALLIADEVFTGYGRLGRMWGCELAGVAPDLLCTAKGFTGGVLPMAATLATDRVLSAFDGGRERAFLYGHSYSGNPLGAAVAREVLAVYRDEKVVEGVAAREAVLREGFEGLRADPVCGRIVEEVRVLGSVAAADLRGSAAPKGVVQPLETESDRGYGAQIGWRVYEEALQRGAYLRPLGNVVYLAPPLNIPLEDLRRLVDILRESVRAAALAS